MPLKFGLAQGSWIAYFTSHLLLGDLSQVHPINSSHLGERVGKNREICSLTAQLNKLQLPSFKGELLDSSHLTKRQLLPPYRMIPLIYPITSLLGVAPLSLLPCYLSLSPESFPFTKKTHMNTSPSVTPPRHSLTSLFPSYPNDLSAHCRNSCLHGTTEMTSFRPPQWLSCSPRLVLCPKLFGSGHSLLLDLASGTTHLLVSFLLPCPHLLSLFYPTSKVGAGLPWWLSGKEAACQCGRHRFNPWSRKSPCVMEWLSLCATSTGPTCSKHGSPRTPEPALHNKRNHRSERPVRCI